jgi:hypothetical protein
MVRLAETLIWGGTSLGLTCLAWIIAGAVARRWGDG